MDLPFVENLSMYELMEIADIRGINEKKTLKIDKLLDISCKYSKKTYNE